MASNRAGDPGVTCSTRHSESHWYKMMSDKRTFITDPGAPRIYQIRLEGHLDHQWSDWFDGLAITLEDNGDTVLTGPVADQAALHGLLKKVRDLGVPLRLVCHIASEQADGANDNA